MNFLYNRKKKEIDKEETMEMRGGEGKKYCELSVTSITLKRVH